MMTEGTNLTQQLEEAYGRVRLARGHLETAMNTTTGQLGAVADTLQNVAKRYASGELTDAQAQAALDTALRSAGGALDPMGAAVDAARQTIAG